MVPADTAAPVAEGVGTDAAPTDLETYGRLGFAVTHGVTGAPGDWVVVLGAGVAGPGSPPSTSPARSAGGSSPSPPPRTSARRPSRAGAEATSGYDGPVDHPRPARGAGRRCGVGRFPADPSHQVAPDG